MSTPNKERIKYPLNRSPLFGLKSKRKLSEILGVDLKDLNNFDKSTLPLQYRIFKDKKTLRFITEPIDDLAVIHKKIMKLLARILPPDYIHSAIKKRSYKTNAEQHIKATQLIKIDIKKFFPSVKFHYIYNFFKNSFETSPDIAFILARLCSVKTNKYGHHLPTGSCISPILSFLANQDLFNEILKLCEAKGCVFTLYVDDITVSGTNADKVLLNEISALILKHGYGCHKFKVYKNVPAKITGLMVYNGKLSLPFERVKKIRELSEALEISTGVLKPKLLSSLVGRLSEGEQLNPSYKIQRLSIVRKYNAEWTSIVANRVQKMKAKMAAK